MARFEKSLKVLESPENEPLNWLAGDALRKHAEATTSSHFLLSALGRPRTGTLTAWNAQIHEFRDLLVNPKAAPRKATADLRAEKTSAADAEDKLLSLIAEVQTPLALRPLGFTKFSVVPAAELASPDFEAEFEGKVARIEVKNLREPKDVVNNIALNQWTKRRTAAPGRYDFNVVLRHSNRGSISKRAENRLRAIIDTLPDRKKPIDEVLDGNIAIHIERLSEPNHNTPDGHMLAEMTKDRPMGSLIVTGAIRAEHFDLRTSELQSLFLKAFKPIANSTGKFFGETYDKEAINVVALRWEPPEPFFSPEMIRYTQEKIDRFFADFELQLKIIIFTDPEMPWNLLRKYK